MQHKLGSTAPFDIERALYTHETTPTIQNDAYIAINLGSLSNQTQNFNSLAILYIFENYQLIDSFFFDRWIESIKRRWASVYTQI